ncbi:uncharacterized protein LOC130719802 [Lotus japonicus]|uniref:uncharacterized protein LOC130719802 n=1 Tax=Lotus japonicus TaxID=34305 RepID=UPI0025908AE1|nr:uncharacterized protein LOC130719802 [Lotus japonicus]
MTKAYDRIEWSFLRSVMEKMGFPQNWVFSALVETAVLSANLSGIRVARATPAISHLLFADDSIVFARANVDEARTLQAIVATYERASRQVINLDKSMLSVSRNVTDNIFDELKQLLNVKAVESYDKYLGLPTVIDGICAEIDSMISRFFWSGDVTRRGLHWTGWKNLCRNKADGGLSFRDFNGVYFPRGSILGAKKGYRPSYAWSSILKASWIFERGGLWRIGDGSKIGLRRDVVEEFFHPTTPAYILTLPLGAHGGDDVLAWPHTTTGQYTSKTGYNYVCGLLALEVATSSSTTGSTLQPKLWRKFWATNALPRCKETAWRAIRGFLPVRDQLFHRHVDTDPGCSLCGHERETIDHIFLRCPAAMAIWYASPLSFRVEHFASFQVFWHITLQQHESEVVEMCQSLVYNIWDVRNRVIFRSGRLVVGDVIDRALGLLVPISPAVREERGGTKACGGGHREGGIGDGCPQPSWGDHGCCDLPSGPSSFVSVGKSERVEVDFTAGKKAWFSSCLFRDGLSSVISVVAERYSGRSYLDTIIGDCRSLVPFFDVFSLSFVRRSGNSVADFLAKNASTYADCVWVEEAPDAVSGLVDLDVIASRPVGP